MADQPPSEERRPVRRPSAVIDLRSDPPVRHRQSRGVPREPDARMRAYRDRPVRPSVDEVPRGRPFLEVETLDVLERDDIAPAGDPAGRATRGPATEAAGLFPDAEARPRRAGGPSDDAAHLDGASQLHGATHLHGAGDLHDAVDLHDAGTAATPAAAAARPSGARRASRRGQRRDAAASAHHAHDRRRVATDRLVVRRMRLRSVAKVAFTFYLCVWAVVAIAGTILWSMANQQGWVTGWTGFLVDIGFSDATVDGPTLARASATAGGIMVVTATLLTVAAACFYNQLGGLIGGIEVTLVAPRSRRRRRRQRQEGLEA